MDKVFNKIFSISLILLLVFLIGTLISIIFKNALITNIMIATIMLVHIVLVGSFLVCMYLFKKKN